MSEELVRALLPLVPLFPALSFALIILVGPIRDNKPFASGLAILSVVLSTIVGWAILFGTLGADLGEHPVVLTIPWIPTGTDVFDLGFLLDPLAGAMLFMVPFVATMIFIYSTGYHNLGRPNVEPRYSRFFAYISLFAAGMLALVIADSLLLFFIAWEIMGLCSYLLIGFWFYKPTAADAAKKAFLTTRVGDVLLFSGLMLLYTATGTLSLHEILTAESIEHLNELVLNLGPLGAVPLLPTIALLIFAGAIGKSAQFPLHVWLPDAMEGPTPVSAMIHAATMVAAGVFLVARTLPLFAPLEGSLPLAVVALIGAFTAIFAATIAVAQNDIKRVLAYSTISQLGYMIAALGVGGLIAAVFHMLTHAFFKALLFMGSGSVIHGMEHGLHATAHGHAEHGEPHAAPEAHFEVLGSPGDEKVAAGHVDPQNMWSMGNLRQHMPTTWWTYLAGTMALAGIPILTAGFWSKDEILAEAWEKFSHGEYGGLLPFVVWLLLTLAAGLTAFYMGRQLGLVFFGRERTAAAEHAHESPRSMTVPLVILALFALVLGFINVPTNLLPAALGGGWFHHYLGGTHLEALGQEYAGVGFNFLVAGISSVLAVVGLLAGTYLYAGRTREPLAFLGPVWRLLENKYYVDEIYSVVVVRPVVAFAVFLARLDSDWLIDPIVNVVGNLVRGLSDAGRWIDNNIVDGLVNFIGLVTDELARGLRLIQTGRVQNYLVILVAGVLVLAALFLQ